MLTRGVCSRPHSLLCGHRRRFPARFRGTFCAPQPERRGAAFWRVLNILYRIVVFSFSLSCWRPFYLESAADSEKAENTLSVSNLRCGAAADDRPEFRRWVFALTVRSN